MSDSCLFCAIAKKMSPAYVVWEDTANVAFLDVYPQATGHTLVVPKKHCSHYWEMPIDEWKQLMLAVRQVTDLLREKTGCKLVRMQIVGLHVPHVHVHLFPSEFPGKELANLAEIAQVIRE